MEPLILIDGINYSHPQSEVCLFDNFSMALAAGKCHVFLGRSGCGKSTLLRLIAGLLKPESGCITIDSINQKSSQKSGWKQFLFQDYDCFPWLNVSDNVKLGSGPPPYPSQHDVDQILLHVGLSDQHKNFPRSLSGGMRKRLGFARTLVRKPQLLLLDEPFASLDIALRTEMYDLLQQLIKDHGTTVILVTHDLHEALLLGDQIYVVGEKPARITTSVANLMPHPRGEEFVSNPFYGETHTHLTSAIHGAIHGKV